MDDKATRVVAYTILTLFIIFVTTCLAIGTLGLWHLAFGWP